MKSYFKNMFTIWMENIIHLCFYVIYRSYAIKYTLIHLSFKNIIQNMSFCTNAPFTGNIAFPDYYSLYIMTFLPPNQKIDYHSFDLAMRENYNLLNISFYDNTGKIVEYYNDHIDSTEYITTDYCIAIVRIYSNNPSNTLNELINENHIQFDIIKQNTAYLTYVYKILINLKKKNLDMSINGFCFSKQNLSLYFTNNSARYLILPVDNTEQIIMIRSKKPDCGLNKPLRYFAFMTCNLNTTETDDCIYYEKLEDNYTIFVAISDIYAIEKGYDASNRAHKIIYWKMSNNNPIIVYREIRVDNKGLFSLNHDASQEDIHRVMGEHYPTIMVL